MRSVLLEVVAENDLVRSDAGAQTWRSTGTDPHFHLLSRKRRRRLRGGWVRIRADLTPRDGTRLAPLLYVDDGTGFRETLTIPLACDADGIDTLVRLPPRVRGLRLDPLIGTGHFHLGAFGLTYLGAVGAVAAISRRLLARLPREERAPRRLASHLLALAREKPLAELWRSFIASAEPEPAPASYGAWIDTVEAPGRLSVATMRAEIAGFRQTPRIAIVMAVSRTPRHWLEAAIASVRAQAYENWELCLCDDAATPPDVGPMLQAHARQDSRIVLHRRGTPGDGALVASAALALATGPYVTLMDPDGVLPDNALYEFVRILNTDDTVDFIYSDEDRIAIDGVRHTPFFKPDWSPETLEAHPYTAHLALYRMDIVSHLGGFRDGFDAAWDYDFVLRYTEHARNVVHVPRVLYHRRSRPGAAARTLTEADHVAAASVRALEDRARRTGALDFVRPGPSRGCFALRRALEARPRVSIVIPSAGRDSEVGGRQVDLLAACLASIRETGTYEPIEIVVVDNGDLRPQTLAALARHDARRVTYSDPVFNVAAKMNLGAGAATGEVLVFLNDDIAVISPDWIEAMLALLQTPGVGAVGPKLLFETGEIQHAGVTFSEGLPDHVRRGYPRDDAGYFFSTAGNRNYLAVTGACVMLRRSDFMAVGGFDEGFAVNYNDIDLCLKLWDRGQRIVYCAQASLYHYESRNRARVVDEAEQDRFTARWGRKLAVDPFYSPWFQHRPPTFVLDPDRF